MLKNLVALFSSFLNFGNSTAHLRILTPFFSVIETSWDSLDQYVFRAQTLVVFCITVIIFIVTDATLIDVNYVNFPLSVVFWIPVLFAFFVLYLLLHTCFTFFVSSYLKFIYLPLPLSVALVTGLTFISQKYAQIIGFTTSEGSLGLGIYIKNIAMLITWEIIHYCFLLPMFLRNLDEKRIQEAPSASASWPGTSIPSAKVVCFGKTKIVATQITHAMICEHYLDVFTTMQKCTLRLQMANFICEVGDNLGIQIHRSIWVSYLYIESIERQGGKVIVKIKNGESFEVARARKEDVVDAITKNVGLLPNATPKVQSTGELSLTIPSDHVHDQAS